MEWKLNLLFFIKFLKIWKTRQELFTTRISKQLNTYVSWHSETRSNGYQCLLLPGRTMISNVPPFSLVGWLLVMIYRDKTNAVVVPDWSTHTGWYLQLLQITNCIFGCHLEMWRFHTKPQSTTCYTKKEKKRKKEN